MIPLPPEEVEAFTRASVLWTRDGDALAASLRFPGFRDAMAFLLRVAFEAEAADHHPEIRNVHARVWLRLSTHDAGGRITNRDLDLARRIEALARPFIP